MKMRGLKPAARKETREAFSALCLEHAARHGRMVIEPGFGKKINYASARARLRVCGAKYDSRYACVHHCACAHHAGLEGHVKFAIDEPVIAQSQPGIPQCHHFGVRGGIAT